MKSLEKYSSIITALIIGLIITVPLIVGNFMFFLKTPPDPPKPLFMEFVAKWGVGLIAIVITLGIALLLCTLIKGVYDNVKKYLRDSLDE